MVRLPDSPPYTATITLTATGGPVTYSISVPAAEQAYLTLTPASGTIAAGKEQVITITVVPPPNGPRPKFSNTATVNPGATVLTIYFPPSG